MDFSTYANNYGLANPGEAQAPPQIQLQQTRPRFLLVPLNSDTMNFVVNLESNARLRYSHPLDPATNRPLVALDITFSNPEKSAYTLGCGDSVDIFLPDEVPSHRSTSRISSLHAVFSFVEATGAVLLEDHSRSRTVELLDCDGCTRIDFKPNSIPRSVLVARSINTRIAFGRDRRYIFEIRWWSDGLNDDDFPKNRNNTYTVGPNDASHPPLYVEGRRMGSGAYGSVWMALDVFTGEVMAVKKYDNLTGKHRDFARREVRNLQRIKERNHNHILQILGHATSQRGDWVDLFMPLMRGSVASLVEAPLPDTPALVDLSLLILYQMLQALDCLASLNLIHRDVKPGNILWEYDEQGNYRFRLGDFGLSIDLSKARTAAGTEPFMAPEVYYRQKQTTKVDIWSLFATIVWIRDSDFRNGCASSQFRPPEVFDVLSAISQREEYARFSGMASMDAAKRPSARRQLMMLNNETDDAADEDDTQSVSPDYTEELASQFNDVNLEDTPRSASGSGSSHAFPIPWYESYGDLAVIGYMEAKAGPSTNTFQPCTPLRECDMGGPYVTPMQSPYQPIDNQYGEHETVVPGKGKISFQIASPPSPDWELVNGDEDHDETERRLSKKRKGKGRR